MSSPLSPHLQVYRWQITSILSILHRITGIVSSLGVIILITFLYSISAGEETFKFIISLSENIFIRTILIGLTFSYLFYFLNCLRHLFWDVGIGLDLNTAKLTGWITILFTVLLTVLFWVLIMIGY